MNNAYENVWQSTSCETIINQPLWQLFLYINLPYTLCYIQFEFELAEKALNYLFFRNTKRYIASRTIPEMTILLMF